MNKFDYDIFTQIRYEDNNSKDIPQGWKLHCSGTMQNYMIILGIVEKVCEFYKADFKYIKDVKNVQFVLSGDCPVESFGKIITIYPNSIDEFVSIAKTLYKRFKEYNGPYILSDKPVFDSEILYYRYGAINRTDGNIIDYDTHNIIEDNRQYFYVPQFSYDPIPYDDGVQSKFINRTVFPKEIINMSSAGNTYLGYFENVSVVIKEARNLVISSKGYAKQDLIREIKAINELKNTSYVPTVVKCFEEFNNSYVIENQLPGVTLDQWAAKNYNEIEDQLPNIFRLIISEVDNLHKHGLIMQDISSSNFLIDESQGNIKGIYICDLGFTHPIEEHWSVDEGATVRFYDSSSINMSPQEQDFHKIGYLFMSLIFPFNNYLISDNSGKKTWELFLEFCNEKNVSKDLIKIIENLIQSGTKRTIVVNDNSQVVSLQHKVKVIELKPLLKEVLNTPVNIRHKLNLYNKSISNIHSYLCSINDFSLREGLSGIGMMFLEDNLLKADEYNFVLSKIDKMIKLCKKNMYLGIDKGILGVFLFKMMYYDRINDNEGLKSVVSDLISFDNCIYHSNHKLDGMTTKSDNKIFSPYIMDGLSGYIILLYEALRYANNDQRIIMVKLINKCVLTILKDSWSKHPGVGYGLTGLLYTVALVQPVICEHIKTRTQSYMNCLYNTVSKMITFSDGIIVYDYQYEIRDFSFINGEKGILMILSDFKKES